MIIDLSPTIKAKSDQLNADDLIAGDIIIKIRKVEVKLEADQPVNIYYEGDDNKPYRPCKGMRLALVSIWGADGSKYIGKHLKLYRNAKVKYAGMEVGGIEISEAEGLKQSIQIPIAVAKGKKRGHIIKPLVIKNAPVEAVSDISESEFIDVMQSIKDNYEKGQEHFTSWWVKFDNDIKVKVKPSLTSEFWNECKKLRAEFTTNLETGE